jgi:membrane-associated phospholipid phosphatase
MILGVSLAAAVGIRQDLDGEIRRETVEHPRRWGDASRVLGHLGEAPYQVPVIGALWGVSLWTDDPELHGLLSTVVSAYTISGLATLATKAATDTDRPDDDWNDGRWGFPSFHAASAFTIAAVLDEYYGCEAGLPAYTLAGLISWSRIDERDHDLSDVVFGAAMGWAIGKSVAGTHLRGDGRVRVSPWMHPTDNAAGLMFDARF